MSNFDYLFAEEIANRIYENSNHTDNQTYRFNFSKANYKYINVNKLIHSFSLEWINAFGVKVSEVISANYMYNNAIIKSIEMRKIQGNTHFIYNDYHKIYPIAKVLLSPILEEQYGIDKPLIHTARKRNFKDIFKNDEDDSYIGNPFEVSPPQANANIQYMEPLKLFLNDEEDYFIPNDFEIIITLNPSNYYTMAQNLDLGVDISRYTPFTHNYLHGRILYEGSNDDGMVTTKKKILCFSLQRQGLSTNTNERQVGKDRVVKCNFRPIRDKTKFHLLFLTNRVDDKNPFFTLTNAKGGRLYDQWDSLYVPETLDLASEIPSVPTLFSFTNSILPYDDDDAYTERIQNTLTAVKEYRMVRHLRTILPTYLKLSYNKKVHDYGYLSTVSPLTNHNYLVIQNQRNILKNLGINIFTQLDYFNTTEKYGFHWFKTHFFYHFIDEPLSVLDVEIARPALYNDDSPDIVPNEDEINLLSVYEHVITV